MQQFYCFRAISPESDCIRLQEGGLWRLFTSARKKNTFRCSEKTKCTSALEHLYSSSIHKPWRVFLTHVYMFCQDNLITQKHVQQTISLTMWNGKRGLFNWPWQMLMVHFVNKKKWRKKMFYGNKASFITRVFRRTLVSPTGSGRWTVWWTDGRIDWETDGRTDRRRRRYPFVSDCLHGHHGIELLNSIGYTCRSVFTGS